MNTLLLTEFQIWLGITILLCSVQAPLSMLIGYLFGSRQARRGFLALTIQILLTMLDTWIFWRMMRLL